MRNQPLFFMNEISKQALQTRNAEIIEKFIQNPRTIDIRISDGGYSEVCHYNDVTLVVTNPPLIIIFYDQNTKCARIPIDRIFLMTETLNDNSNTSKPI